MHLLTAAAYFAFLLHAAFSSDKDWALHCQEYVRKEYSQSGQDGIIEYIVSHIGTAADERNEVVGSSGYERGLNGVYVEFGFNSASYEGGSGSNTYWLWKTRGWTGLLLDGEYHNESINLHATWISEENICDTFQKHGLDYYDIDYLSIDIDSIDFWVLRGIFSCGYRPRLISVEYNSNFPMRSFLVTTKDSRRIRQEMHGEYSGGYDRLYGASFGALNMLCAMFGYTAVAVVTSLDVFFVRNDFLSGSRTFHFNETIVEHEQHSPCPSRSVVERGVMDYSVFIHSKGNITKAMYAAAEQKDSLARLYTRFSFISVDVGRESNEYFFIKFEVTGTDISSFYNNNGPLIRNDDEIWYDISMQMRDFCQKYDFLRHNKEFCLDYIIESFKTQHGCSFPDSLCSQSKGGWLIFIYRSIWLSEYWAI